jgi:hypothetical protein
MNHRPTKAGEAAMQRLIRSLRGASDALDAALEHFPATRPDDSRILLKRQADEYASYLEAAEWWRFTKPKT